MPHTHTHIYIYVCVCVTAADYNFLFCFFTFRCESSAKQMICELSAWQTIHMKCHNLFSLKIKKKNENKKLSSAAVEDMEFVTIFSSASGIQQHLEVMFSPHK